MSSRDDRKTVFEPGKTWVIKIGSSLLTRNGTGLATESMSLWVEQIVKLRQAGIQVVLVSSGAVAEADATIALGSKGVVNGDDGED